MAGANLRNVMASPFVHVVGRDLSARVEDHPNPDYVDHVWITMTAGSVGRVLVAVNTLSRLNRDAGHDPRVRVGVIRGTWNTLPHPVLENVPGLNYGTLEKESSVFFEHFERPALDTLLLDTTHRAVVLEVWGAPYHNRKRLGVHQVHSRRASCAMREDVQNLDGALRFYFADDHTTAMFLFKFCGQV